MLPPPEAIWETYDKAEEKKGEVGKKKEEMEKTWGKC